MQPYQSVESCWEKNKQNTIHIAEYFKKFSVATLSMIFFFKVLQNHTLYPLVKYTWSFMLSELYVYIAYIEHYVYRAFSCLAGRPNNCIATIWTLRTIKIMSMQ